ncbi:MAG: DUF2785 domain-containing protein [Anaerolineae bacterium]|nr:DUF2785 domain-containing protein [Anaerolineae bacterium]MCB9459255.1 DUF2785 domain-containing protein [Anaerolineaceae bacterium]
MDVAFWQQIVDSYYQIPEDCNLIDLTSDLMQHLGASDPQLRDKYAYNILSRWITLYDYHTPDELRQMIDWLLPRLQTNIGSINDDSVFERSYAALILSLIAYRDTRSSFLEMEEMHELMRIGCEYLLYEADSRAYIPEKGWANAYNHAADFLRFLVYSPLLAPNEQMTVLHTVAKKVMMPADTVYIHDEDDRFARIVIAVLRRSEVLMADLVAWQRHFTNWRQENPKPEEYQLTYHATHQNIKMFLRALLAQVELMEYLPHVAHEFLPALIETVRPFTL